MDLKKYQDAFNHNVPDGYNADTYIIVCPKCHKEFQATPGDVICPECGTELTFTIDEEVPAEEAAEEETVDEEE